MADNFETVGVRAVVQNMGGYLADIGRMESATKQSLNHIGMAWGAIGLAGVAGFGLSAKAAIDFESSFAGVAKTVDATQEELADLAQGMRDLAKEIPVNVNELNRIGEAAGALGIAKGDILAFTETVAMLGATTNLSSEEAATGMARLANIMQVPQDAFDRLGATLVDLGNKGASTEDEILDMALRIGGAGNVIGLSADQVLAFANGLSSVGIQAELGGSAISRIMIEIAKNVEMGGEKLQLFAAVSGMSAEQFQAAWEQDAAGALIAFIENLGKLEAQGGSTFQVLDALGLDAIRVEDTLLRAAGSGDLLRESLQNGATAWQENSAHMTEFEKRAATTAAQMQLLQNHLNDAAIAVGQKLIPVLLDGIEVLQAMISAWEQLPTPVQDAVLRLGAVVTVISLVGGASLLVLPRIASLVQSFQALGLVGVSLPGMMGRLALALGTITIATYAATGLINDYKAALGGIPAEQERVNQVMAGFISATQDTQDREIISQKAIESLVSAREGLGELTFGLDAWKSGMAEQDVLLEGTAKGLKNLSLGMLDLTGHYDSQADKLAKHKDDIRGVIAALEQQGFAYEDVVRILNSADISETAFPQELEALKERADGMAASDWATKVVEQINMVATAAAGGADGSAAKIELLAQQFDKLDVVIGANAGSAAATWDEAVTTIIKGADLTDSEIEALIERLQELGKLPAGAPKAEEFFRALVSATREGTEEVKALLGDKFAGLLDGVGEAGDDMAEKWKKAMDGAVKAIQSALPSIGESFDEWRTRLAEMAQAYLLFDDNLQFILQTLVSRHTEHADEIKAAVKTAGPDVAWAMATYLAQQPADAVDEVLKDLAPIAAYHVAEAQAEVEASGEGMSDSFAYTAGKGVEGFTGELSGADVSPWVQAFITRAAANAQSAAAASGAALGGSFVAAFQQQVAALPRGIALQAESEAGVLGFKLPVIAPPPYTPPTPPERLTSGGGGGAKERTPEEMIVDAAQAADTVASAIEHVMEVFDKIGDFSGDVDFDALRRLRDAIFETVIIFGQGVNEASLRLVEDAGEWAGNADKVIGLIGSGVDNFKALEDYGAVNRGQLLQFIDDFVFGAEQFSARIPSSGALTTSAAASWADHADKVVGLISGGVDSLLALTQYTGLNRSSLVRFADDYVYAAEAFSARILAGSRQVGDTASDWADDASSVVGLIDGGVDAFLALDDYGGLSRARFHAFVSDYVYAAEEFSGRIPTSSAKTTEAASQWAENAEAVVGAIADGVSNLLALTDYATINRRTFEQFTSDYIFVAETFAAQIAMRSRDVNEAAALWADQAGAVVGLIGDGVTAFEALEDYSSVSRRAVHLFIRDYIFVAEEFASEMPGAAAKTTEAATVWADNASSLVSVIGDGVDAFASLEDYGGLSRLALAAFVSDYIFGVEYFARRIPDATSELDEAVADWADTSGSIVGVIAAGVAGFAALEDYGSVSQRALIRFIDDLIFGVQYFNEQVAGWDVDAAEAAGTIAGVAESVVGAIGAAAEVFESNLATAGLFRSSLELILDMLIHVVNRWVRETAYLADEASEGAVNLSEVGVNIFSAIVMLGESLQDGYYASERARDSVYEMGRVLVDLVTYFASGVQYFDEETAATTLQLSEAARNIVESFVLMQGDLNRVNTRPLFRFMFDMIYGFQNVLYAARALRTGGAEADMAFLSTLVQFIRDFLEQLGLQFEVPKPPPKPPEPPKEDKEPKEPPAPVIPREPLTPVEIQEVIDALMSGLFEMIENLDIPDEDLDMLERKAKLIETMANAFRDIGQAVESAGDADTGAFFKFMDKFLGGLGELLDDMGGLSGSLTPLAQIISSIAMLVENIDRIERIGALDPFVMEQAASNLSTFILETLRILAEGVEDLPIGQLQNLGTVLDAITAFLESLSGAVGSQLGIPSYDVGSWSIPQTGPAMLHQREMVLSPSLADAVRVALSTPALSAPSGNMVNIGEINLNFGAGVDEAMVRRGVGGALTDAGSKGYTVTLRSKGYIQ